MRILSITAAAFASVLTFIQPAEAQSDGEVVTFEADLKPQQAMRCTALYGQLLGRMDPEAENYGLLTLRVIQWSQIVDGMNYTDSQGKPVMSKATMDAMMDMELSTAKLDFTAADRKSDEGDETAFDTINADLDSCEQIVRNNAPIFDAISAALAEGMQDEGAAQEEPAPAE